MFGSGRRAADGRRLDLLRPRGASLRQGASHPPVHGADPQRLLPHPRLRANIPLASRAAQALAGGRRTRSRASWRRSRCGPMCNRGPSRRRPCSPPASAISPSTSRLPQPLKWLRPASRRHGRRHRSDRSGHVVTGLNDQHCHLAVPRASPLRSATWWRSASRIPARPSTNGRCSCVVNDDYDIVSAVRTFF